MQQAHDDNKRKPARNSFLVEFLVWSSPFVLSVVWFDHQVSKDIDALIHHCASVPGAAADNAPASGKRSAEAGAGAVAALPPAAINFGGYAAPAPVPVGNTGTTLKTIAGGSDV